jgi:hypothetical protein
LPDTTPKRYRVTEGRAVATRKSSDKESPDWDVFLRWESGKELKNLPDHADIKGWLEVGAIEEIT